MNWLRSMRPGTVLMAVLLYFVGFSLIGWQEMSWSVAVFLFVAGVATMANNDWEDRRHDLKKGKTFAYSKGYRYWRFVVVLWLLSAFAIAWLTIEDMRFGLLSLVLMIVGMYYSGFRDAPMVPGMYVALTATGPLLYAVLVRPTSELILLLVSTALFVYGREVVKDLEDMEVDRGYKWTLPNHLGRTWSKRIALATFIVALGLSAVINWMVLPFSLLGGFTIFWMLFSENSERKAKRMGDVLIVITFLIIMIGDFSR